MLLPSYWWIVVFLPPLLNFLLSFLPQSLLAPLELVFSYTIGGIYLDWLMTLFSLLKGYVFGASYIPRIYCGFVMISLKPSVWVKKAIYKPGQNWVSTTLTDYYIYYNWPRALLSILHHHLVSPSLLYVIILSWNKENSLHYPPLRSCLCDIGICFSR